MVNASRDPDVPNDFATRKIRNVREKSPRPKTSTPPRKIQKRRGKRYPRSVGVSGAAPLDRSRVNVKMHTADKSDGKKLTIKTTRIGNPNANVVTAMSGPTTAPSMSAARSTP